METTRRLHPLVAVAAVLLILVSAVGIAALTGLIPTSTSSSSPDQPQGAAQPSAPGMTPPADAPRPVARAKGLTGTVEAVREVKKKGEGTGAGAVAGGVVGGVLGHQIGEGSGKKLATVLGAAGGAVAGHQVERSARATSHWEISVRLDDGSTRTLTTDQPPSWHAGDRVRMVGGRLQPA
jgi:outer membrane lipoprotein SlyB